MRLVYIILAWTTGIVLASNAITPYPAAWLILALIAAGAAWFWRDDDRLRSALALIAVLMLGALRMSLTPTTSLVAAYNGVGGLTLEGVVIEAPDVRDDGVRLRLAAETVTRIGATLPTQGIVLVRAPLTAREVRYGDRITATGLLITPAEYDTFSYADFLAREGVFSIMENAIVEVVSSGHGSPLYARLLDLRRTAGERIADALPEPQSGLLSGILLGEQRGIAPEVSDAFAATGVAHVIAISGFNMAILSESVMRLFGRYKSRWWAAAIGVVVLTLYTLFVGANAAVVRAAIMASLLLIAPLLKRRTYIPATLAYVALLMTLHNPTVLWDVSFQLSFFATLGLALFVDPFSTRFDALLRRLLPRNLAQGAARLLTEPLIVTLAASVTTLPIIVLYFNRLSLVMLFVNLLIVPFQAALLIVGVITLIAALILPAVGQIGFWFALVLLSWTIDVVRLFARLPFAETEFYVDPRLVAAFFILLIGGAVLNATQPPFLSRLSAFVRRRRIFTALSASGVLLLILFVALFRGRPDGNLHVWMLNMGHTNAALIQTPGGVHILIDGGNFPSRLLTALGDRLPFNKQTIDVLVITQPDEFDTGALTSVLERYNVPLVITNGHPNQGEVHTQLMAALTDSQIVTVRTGFQLELSDGTRIEILSPATQPALGDSIDDNALVLRVVYGETSFLLTGDLSISGQSALLDAGQFPLATVMQLPQHGTTRSLSESFLRVVQPSAITLQSDPANRRGDPDADVLALLPDVPLLRTDRGGTIHLRTDGAQLWAMQER